MVRSGLVTFYHKFLPVVCVGAAQLPIVVAPDLSPCRFTSTMRVSTMVLRSRSAIISTIYLPGTTTIRRDIKKF